MDRKSFACHRLASFRRPAGRKARAEGAADPFGGGDQAGDQGAPEEEVEARSKRAAPGPIVPYS